MVLSIAYLEPTKFIEDIKIPKPGNNIINLSETRGESGDTPKPRVGAVLRGWDHSSEKVPI